MARVLVTGAAGFLGKHLVHALHEKGYDTVAFDRLPQPDVEIPVQRLEYHVLPKPNRVELAPLLEGVDVVYHLAALRPATHFDLDSIRECLESNIVLSLNLLQASLSCGVKRFIYFSAGNAYSLTSMSPAAEEDALYPAHSDPLYLGSKILAENLVEHYRQIHGLEALSLRISSPYGTGMPVNSVVMNFIRQARQGLPLQVRNGGRFRSDLVFVQDVIDLVLMATRIGPSGVYNVGSGVATSMIELAGIISDVFNCKVPMDVLPIETKSSKGFRPLDIHKAKLTWQWIPRSLHEGLEVMKSEIQAVNAV